mgnify:CR=1 FL=1
MKLYTIYSASEAEQALILSQIPLIGQLQEPYQQKTLDAYATALKNSTFPSLADAPAIAPTTVFWRISTRSLKPG